VTFGREVRGIGVPVFEGRNLVHRGAEFHGDVTIGEATTIGTRAHVHGPVTIGRYCQLAPEVAVYGTNHPINHISTYVNERLLDRVIADFRDVRPVTIGHDVWLGYRTIVVPGISIANGAVAGGGAVVTTDVGPYEIVGGNPARMIGRRFDDQVVDLLQRSAWWDLDQAALDQHRSVFEADLTTPEGVAALAGMVDQVEQRRR
jgi:virginiamycin A acetyltransferase